MPGAQIDGLTGMNPGSDITQHPITQVNGIIKTDDGNRGLIQIAEILKNPLSSQSGLGIGPRGSVMSSSVGMAPQTGVRS